MTGTDPRLLLGAESESQTVRALLEMREMLMRGEFKPGEHIREIPVAEKLGVSRTPARLVLERLAHEGLVEARAKGGFVVRAFTLQDILDAIEIRGELEGTAARMAAERLHSEEELAPMRHCLAEVDALLTHIDPVLESIAAYTPINERFHGVLLDLAKSPILTRSLDQVRALPFATPSAFTGSQAEPKTWTETLTVANWHHRCIVEAISARNAIRASAIAREHCGLARRGVELALRQKRLTDFPGGSLVRLPGTDEHVPMRQ
jgi:GntR family transcriptional regulator of vanillate catabolism